MCRFALYLGSPVTLSSLVTEPAHSIIRQSFESREREPLNGDGFGLAWYVPELSERPALFRSISPAWNNPNLEDVSRVSRSSCVLAHVRAASPGLPVTQLNCHPFSWRHLAFMHNGYIAGFQGLRRRLLASLSDEAFHLIQGSTDSEHFFALIVERWIELRDLDGVDRLVEALRQAMTLLARLQEDEGIEGVSILNVGLADGRTALASRWTDGEASTAASLHWRTGGSYACMDQECSILDPHLTGALLVASEPLSNPAAWRDVPVNHLILAAGPHDVEIQPLTP